MGEGRKEGGKGREMAKGASERAKWLKEQVEGFKRVEVR